MALTVLVVVVIWFIGGFLIHYFFENKQTDARKKGFHIATALQILINIIAFVTVLSLLLG